MALVRVNKFRPALALLLTAAIAAPGCSSLFEQRYAEAERWRQDAAAAGYEWLETKSLLEQAREQEALGNAEAALALLDKARFQAEMAVKQAEHEAEAWRSRVVQ